VQDLAAGGFHTCVINENGAAMCWGDNEAGQIGNGDEGPDSCFIGRTIPCAEGPEQVQGLMSGVTDIAAGGSHTCALHNGVVKCWGSNVRFQLARDEPAGCASVDSECFSRTPVTIAGVGGDMIEAGEDFSCVVSGATVQCWGRNSFGQLDGEFGPDDCPGGFQCSQAPVSPPGILGEIVELSLGGSHTCARLENGAVQCWGHGFYGALGNDDADDRSEPIIPTGFAGGVVTPTPLPDLVWGDFDCSGTYNADDGLAIIAWWADLELAAAQPAGISACPGVATHPQINGAEGIWADSNCLDDVTLEDALLIFADLAGIAASGLPGFCPELGEPVDVG
jgi:alpha-tubulin suppressor-like RCC1 family protein